MKNIHTSVVVEENWVEAHTSKLQSLPTATSALELDVSMNLVYRALHIFIYNESLDFVPLLLCYSYCYM